MYQSYWYGVFPDVSPKSHTAHRDGIVYEWVEGVCPCPQNKIQELLSFCHKLLWSSDTYRQEYPHHIKRYLLHCLDVAVQVKQLPVYEWVHDKLYTSHPTFTYYCHGDLTLENVVYCNNSFVFIDPGRHWGLCCQEIDETKVMQSIEEVHLTRPVSMSLETLDLYYRWRESPLHMALLATHYLRMLRYTDKHPNWRIAHAKDRLNSIINEV